MSPRVTLSLCMHLSVHVSVYIHVSLCGYVRGEEEASKWGNELTHPAELQRSSGFGSAVWWAEPCPSERSMLPCWPPVPQNGTSFGDIWSLYRGNQCKTRSLAWALIQYDCVLIQRQNLGTESDMHGGKTVRAQGEWHRQAKEHLRLPEVGRCMELILPHHLQKELTLPMPR